MVTSSKRPAQTAAGPEKAPSNRESAFQRTLRQQAGRPSREKPAEVQRQPDRTEENQAKAPETVPADNAIAALQNQADQTQETTQIATDSTAAGQGTAEQTGAVTDAWTPLPETNPDQPQPAPALAPTNQQSRTQPAVPATAPMEQDNQALLTVPSGKGPEPAPAPMPPTMPVESGGETRPVENRPNPLPATGQEAVKPADNPGRSERVAAAETARHPVVSALLNSLNESGKQSSDKSAHHEQQRDLKQLVEWESRRLGGQKVPTAPSAPAADNAAAKESGPEPAATMLKPESTVVKPVDFSGRAEAKMPLPMDVDGEDVLNQVIRKAELMVKLNSSQMKIELHPEFLGKLTIKVMVEEGAVTARFITDNHQVKQMLETNLGLLRQSLEAQGMRVERAEVNVQLNNGGLFDGSESQRQWMWQHTQQQRNPGSGRLEQEGFDPVPAFTDVPGDAAGYYGFQADGSMDFLV